MHSENRVDADRVQGGAKFELGGGIDMLTAFFAHFTRATSRA